MTPCPNKYLHNLLLVAFLLITGCAVSDPPPAASSLLPEQVTRLNGTRWALVAIQSMDDTTIQPAAGTQYTLAFLPQGRFAGQADCNRLQGGWARTGKSQLQFADIVTTRALCPPQTIAGRFLSDLAYTRSFVMTDGHLFLATLADGAILEFAPLPAPTPMPAFDCREADAAVETLLCEDSALMPLDLYLDELYQGALASFPHNELPTLRAFQRGWISGRNDCWKDRDMRACVIAEYRRRLSELEVKTGYLTVPAAVDYTCDDGSRVSAYFYNNAVSSLAVLDINDAQVFAWLARSGSGARYIGRNIEFWLKANEAVLTTLTAMTTCTAI